MVFNKDLQGDILHYNFMVNVEFDKNRIKSVKHKKASTLPV